MINFTVDKYKVFPYELAERLIDEGLYYPGRMLKTYYESSYYYLKDTIISIAYDNDKIVGVALLMDNDNVLKEYTSAIPEDSLGMLAVYVNKNYRRNKVGLTLVNLLSTVIDDGVVLCDGENAFPLVKQSMLKDKVMDIFELPYNINWDIDTNYDNFERAA